MYFRSKPTTSAVSWLPLSIVVCHLITACLGSLNYYNLDEFTDAQRVSSTPFRFRRAATSPSPNFHPIGNTTTTTKPPTSNTPKQSGLNLTSESPKTSSNVTAPNKKEIRIVKAPAIRFEVRDVARFLEIHSAHSIHDPRAYFTEERTTRSLAILLKELENLPKKLRFAYTARIFNELGRKITSKLNYYVYEIEGILNKPPDQLGNKLEVSILVDVVKNAFESKEDREPMDDEISSRNLTSLIAADREKAVVFNSSVNEISSRFAHMISYFFIQANKTALKTLNQAQRNNAAILLMDALKVGASDFTKELQSSDKYLIQEGIVSISNEILGATSIIFKRHIKDNDERFDDQIANSFKEVGDVRSFKDLNSISDETGLIGPWNSYLFGNLGSSERVVKLFSSLLSRVPPKAKTRWINMYISQVYEELEQTMSGFVIMQGMPHYNGNSSQDYLLNFSHSASSIHSEIPKSRNSYSDDKNRLPARCYLAGRRWRLFLSKALKDYSQRDEVLKDFIDKVGDIKLKLVNKVGNEMHRKCLPRLEVGLRGWGIDGEPHADGGQLSRFAMKNPIDDLHRMDNPFASGIQLGYNLGFKIGYNEERNATLEMESAGEGQQDSVNASAWPSKLEVQYLARASYRRATTVGAKKAIQIAIHEGYLTTLKISVRAGMLIAAEAGSRMASLRCVSYSGQDGAEAGRSVAESYIVNKKIDDSLRKSLIKVGEAHGLLAGRVIGDKIGTIVGKQAAEEAFKHTIIRGGKVKRAKFHLEEYEFGALLGFDFGLKEGKRVASSSSLDPSAPRFFRLPKPVFSDDEKSDHQVDDWEKELIPKLSAKVLSNLEEARNHTSVSGYLRGVYRVANEVKKGLKRVTYSNLTYNLEVFADGFIKNNVAYLTLNGTVDKIGFLRGSLIARDIFNDFDEG